jgi:hypothetical protein
MGSVSVSKMIVKKKTQEKNSKKKVTKWGVRTIIVLPNDRDPYPSRYTDVLPD